jgi:hypothetical protein
MRNLLDKNIRARAAMEKGIMAEDEINQHN